MGVENTVGKGEIARYEQFLLCPQGFQKACFPGASKGVIVWEWVKRLIFGMRAHIIDTQLVVPRTRSFAKVKVKHYGKNKKGSFWSISISQTQLFLNLDCR